MDDLAERRTGQQRWAVTDLPAFPGRTVLSRLQPLAWLVVPVAIAVVSRGFSAALVELATRHIREVGPLLTIYRNPLVAWDGQWYLSIAANGYHAQPLQPGPLGGHHDFAFFPVWPMLIRIASLAWPRVDIVAVVLANVLFIAAAVVIWRLFEARYGARVATGGVALLAFSPAAYVFSMAYSESAFLLLAGTYLAARASPGRRVLSAWLAMLTRIAGVGVLAAAAVRAVVSRGEERRTALTVVATSLIAFAAWWVVIALITGDPMGFMRGSPAWVKTSGYGSILDAVRRPNPESVIQLGYPALLLLGSLLVLRRDVELGVYALAVTLLGALPGGLIPSMPRYALLAFPAFAAISERLGRRGTVVLVLVFAVAQWFFVGWAFTGRHPLAP
ncbi:MAG TPA: mannosyltransferase family protein [Candidatus Limnocylindrales bacterium]